MDRSLSIAFVTNNYLPYSGGVVSSLHAFYDELVRQGHTVTIITLDFLGSREHEDGRKVIRLACPIKFTYGKNYMAIPWFMNFQLQRILCDLNPDIVHLHHPFLLGPAACRVAKKMQKPVVFTHHTLYEHYLHYVPFPAAVTKPLVRRLVKDFCHRVDRIIAPSSSVKSILYNQGVVTPTVVLPSPINPTFFTHQHGNQWHQCTRFHLLTVSRFTKEKNISFLLDMFAQLDQRKYELTLVGFGSALDSLRRYAYTTLGLSLDNVSFIEKPSKQELAEYYQTADLFVYASQTETQGLVIAESLASGLPVVALTGPGQEDIIMDGTNGYLVADRAAMIDTIQRCADDKALLMRLKEGAKITAQKYAPEVLTKRLIDVYLELI